MTLSVEVQRTARQWAPPRADIAAWVSTALGRNAAGRELGVRVVGPTESRRLNARYRGKDKATNVLSFPAVELPAGPERPLGDLVICPDVLRAEARQQHKSLRAHWAHLVVHGTLHLVGYDHEDPADADRMERREIAVLRRLGFPNPYRSCMMAKDLNATGRWLKRITQSFSGEPQDRDELLAVLREAGERGLVDSEALTMLEGVLEVGDIQVRDIMVPRAQMVCVRREDPAGTIMPIVVESGHSRFPVMDGDRDDIVGILLAKDLLRLSISDAHERFDIREYMRPAVFVPESKRLNVLLKDFRRNRNHMAIVVDEYGGVSGLVTIEDVMEQIVGEIDDEFDVEDDLNIRKEADRQYTVRGVTRIDEFNEYFGSKLSEEEGFDTVAGLLMKELGRLPRRGEAANIDGFEFRVARADRRRIDALRVVPPRDLVPLAERLPGSES